MRRAAILVIGMLLAVTPTALAEVCAIFSNSGHFLRLDLNFDLENGIVWGPVTDRYEAELCLNLNGDGGVAKTHEDLADVPSDDPPVYTVVWMPEESPAKFTLSRTTEKSNRKAKRKTPLVAWARSDGHDREMAYSFWDYSRNAWSDISFVERVDNPIDDLNPRIKSRDGGRSAELSWTRNGATEQVFEATGTPFVAGPSYDISWSEPEETTRRPGRQVGKTTFRPGPSHKE